MTTSEIKIGDRLWSFDGNRRAYDKAGRLIEAHQYEAVEVVGETRKCWIVATPGSPRLYVTSIKGLPWKYTAVNKDTMRESGGSSVGYGPKPYFTDADREALVWLAEHHRAIVNAVEKCKDMDTLKAIAALATPGSPEGT